MIQFSEVLSLLDAGEVTVEIPVTSRLAALIEADVSDIAQVDDLTARFGDRPVTALTLDHCTNRFTITLGN